MLAAAVLYHGGRRGDVAVETRNATRRLLTLSEQEERLDTAYRTAPVYQFIGPLTLPLFAIACFPC